MIRLGRQCLLEMDKCIGRASENLQCNALLAEFAGRRRTDRQRGLEAGQGLGRPVQRQQCPTAIDERIDGIRVHPQCLPKRPLRVVETPMMKRNEARQVQPFNIVGLYLEHSTTERFGRIQISLHHEGPRRKQIPRNVGFGTSREQ